MSSLPRHLSYRHRRPFPAAMFATARTRPRPATHLALAARYRLPASSLAPIFRKRFSASAVDGGRPLHRSTLSPGERPTHPPNSTYFPESSGGAPMPGGVRLCWCPRVLPAHRVADRVALSPQAQFSVGKPGEILRPIRSSSERIGMPLNVGFRANIVAFE